MTVVVVAVVLDLGAHVSGLSKGFLNHITVECMRLMVSDTAWYVHVHNDVFVAVADGICTVRALASWLEQFLVFFRPGKASPSILPCPSV